MSTASLLPIAEALLQLPMIVMVGLYFTFSNTVMSVLEKQQDGARIMIEINKQILNPIFLTCFILSAVAGLYFFFFHNGFQSWSGLIFFVGTTMITVLFNVPLNDKLRDAAKNKVSEIWREYLSKWVFWNHIRTISALCAALMASI
jgi:uncharacterized membrane protein